LVRWRGTISDPGTLPAASVVADVLKQRFPLAVLVHPQLLEQPDLVKLPDAVPLFDWLPDEQARHVSPLVLPPGSYPEIAALIDAGWDKNAILCLFSRQPPADLVEHLRSVIRVPFSEQGENGAPDSTAPDSATAKETPPKSILGFCWPNVLSAMIDCGQPAFMQRLLDGIDLVLMEVPGQPGGWQIVGDAQHAEPLVDAGFRETEPSDP
jgi:hypothetical protein